MTGIPHYNVSELTYLIKNTLENQFPVIRVQGEISTFRPASSGHCYFNLKDRDSIINAVMFRQQRSRLPFAPADGQSVVILGRVSVYPQRGNYQLICESMEQAGQGDILLRLEWLKKQLEKEGLFDPSGKRPLPKYPYCIAVVTSLRGAALQDILQILQRRMKSCKILIKDTVVQGESSASSILNSLQFVNAREDVDLIILSRGGGSLEDLLSFSDEAVVRAVAKSRIPVITGIGHEIDFSLCDFAADFRAATPSAAAEIVSQHTVEAFNHLHQLKSQINQSMVHGLEKQRWRFSQWDRSVLSESMKNHLENRQQTVDLWRIENQKILSDKIQKNRYRVKVCREILMASSPEQILSRGFALVRHGENIVTSAKVLKQGDRVQLQFHDLEKTAVIEGD